MKKEGHVLKTFVSLFSKRNCIKTKTQAETQSIYNYEFFFRVIFYLIKGKLKEISFFFLHKNNIRE